MEKLIIMLAIGWVPQHDGTLKEVWRFEKSVSLEHCITINQVFSGGGKAGAITVRCGNFKQRVTR